MGYVDVVAFFDEIVSEDFAEVLFVVDYKDSVCSVFFHSVVVVVYIYVYMSVYVCFVCKCRDFFRDRYEGCCYNNVKCGFWVAYERVCVSEGVFAECADGAGGTLW